MHKDAFALSIVLWIVAALLFGVATLAVLSKDTHSLTKGVSDKLDTQLAAQDVLELLKFYIVTADYDNNSFMNSSLKGTSPKLPTKIILDNRWYQIDKSTKIRMQDSSALINVFNANANRISIIATTPSQRQERYVIRDSIMDWSDKDNIVKLNGAEASRYELKENLKYKIRNSPALQSVEELRLIRGIDALSEQRWLELKQRVYYGNGSTINLSLLDAKELARTLQINRSQAESYIQVRATNLKRFIKLTQSLKTFNDEEMGFYLSKQLKIEVEVTKQSARSELKVLIDFKRFKDKLYTTHYYSLN